MFKGKEMSGISPITISSVMSSQSFIMPLIVMMVIIYAGSIVISSMGSEKENKTLETLLTMPVSRTSIVFGKADGGGDRRTADGGHLHARHELLLQFADGFELSIDLAQYGLTLSIVDYILVGMLALRRRWCSPWPCA